jgi:hypothetical protein
MVSDRLWQAAKTPPYPSVARFASRQTMKHALQPTCVNIKPLVLGTNTSISAPVLLWHCDQALQNASLLLLFAGTRTKGRRHFNSVTLSSKMCICAYLHALHLLLLLITDLILTTILTLRSTFPFLRGLDL